jgi:hypothetical protein
LEGSPASEDELDSDGSEPPGLGEHLQFLSGGLGGGGRPSPPGGDGGVGGSPPGLPVAP